MLNWIVNEKKIAPHIPVIDKSKREKTSNSSKNGTFISAQAAKCSPRSRAPLPDVTA
jgi:hypothetical protein